MIEQDLENILKDKLSQILINDDCEIIGSWSPVSVGNIKGETKKDAKCIVSIYIQPRQHDNFSLPTVNVSGTVAMQFRVEQCPTMKEVADTYDKVLTYFDDLHFDAVTFSDDFSSNSFFATEIMLNGGDKVIFDRTTNSWIVSINFVIRGNVNR